MCGWISQVFHSVCEMPIIMFGCSGLFCVVVEWTEKWHVLSIASGLEVYPGPSIIIYHLFEERMDHSYNSYHAGFNSSRCSKLFSALNYLVLPRCSVSTLVAIIFECLFYPYNYQAILIVM